MSEQTQSANDESSVSEDALLVFNPSTRALLYVNGAAARLFETREDELLARDADDVLAELADVTPRDFSSRMTTRLGNEREIRVHLVPLRSGAFVRVGAVLAVISPVLAEPLPAGTAAPKNGSTLPASHTAAVDGQPPVVDLALERRLGRLESLWEVVVRHALDGAEQATLILQEGVHGLDLESANLGRVEGHEYVVDFASDRERDLADARHPLTETLAGLVQQRGRPYAVEDTHEHADTAANAEVQTGGIRSFIAAPFQVGEVRRVLVLQSAQPRPQPFNAEDEGYLELLVDALGRIVRLRENDEQIKALAFSDPLTGLPNRAAFLGRLDEALAAAERHHRRTAMLFLDVDGFKSVNDTVGHHAGDKVLAEMAQRLRRTLRREEYIGRLGGDEFGIVLPQITSREEIEQVAQRISNVLAFPFLVEQYRFALSASVGVAVYPNDATERDDLLTCADAAMYSAKQGGRARMHYHDPASIDAGSSAAPPSDLALEPGEIGYLLCYQPILELATSDVVSAEALIRRVHPFHGLLAPERILTSVRSPEERRSLDRWVLREAATQIRAWHLAGKTMQVEVNLASFDPEDFDAVLADDNDSIDFSRISVEISETLLRGDRGKIGDFLSRCKARGMSISLDNFEGGLAALSTLAHLPIDAVKLDRMLVESITLSKTAAAIAEGSIKVAKTLGWRVIAKGVETTGQFELLQALGCDSVQGFRIGHPMTALDFANWLNLHRSAAYAT